jgi:SHS2 domain-containing protein
MFEILEHTADIGLRAWGDTLEELFGNASLALTSIAVELDNIEPRVAYPIAASGEDLESLLVNWLSEVLYYLDGERVAMRRFEIRPIEGGRATGQGWGEPRDPARHAAKLIVKGVTYHQLSIHLKEGRWQAEVYLDI